MWSALAGVILSLLGTPALAQGIAPGTAYLPGAALHVGTQAALAAASTVNYPDGVWRDHYWAGGIADGPVFFTVQSGNCAANGYVDDGGDCVDASDGNSFKAAHLNGVMNVKEFGAKGDNGTDDTASIQAAIDAAENATPGYYRAFVAFPSGNYCIKTASGVSTSASRISLIGYGNPIIKVCGSNDIKVVTLNGNQNRIFGLQIQGWNDPTVTQAALTVGSSCVDCVVEWSTVSYGYRAIDVAAADAVIKHVKAEYAYGPSIARATAGTFWIRDKFDQTYPNGAPPSAPYTLNAWAATTAYSAGDLVTIASGAWILQATAGGTSGGGEPSVAAYGSDITDGSVTWRLATPLAATGFYFGLQLDTGAAPVFVEKLDVTGSFSYGVGLTNDTGGGGPQLVTLRDGNYGRGENGGVFAGAGAGLFIEGGSATNCVFASCYGVRIYSGFSDKVHIGDGFIAYANPYGVYAEAGNFVVSGASIHGASIAAVYVAAGVTKFAITNNDLSTGSTWGTSAIGVQVAAGGSDYYVIANNIVQGSTTGVADAGTGTNKTVVGNQ